MAHSLSQRKRVRQNLKRRALNRWHKRRFRLQLRSYREAILHGSNEDAQAQLSGLYKLIDQLAAKSVIHRNTAARYKARLADRLNRKRGHQQAA
ncbi:MAG: 30S ribosomal protein S20 [Phycisphaeraceae bacterium]